MIGIAEDLIKSFEMLNKFLDRKLLSKNLLIGAHDSIKSFEKIKQDMVNFLDEINDFDIKSGYVDDLNMSLIHLHLEVSAVECRIGDVRDVIEVIIGRYRKLVRDQGYAKD